VGVSGIDWLQELKNLAGGWMHGDLKNLAGGWMHGDLKNLAGGFLVRFPLGALFQDGKIYK
jgi:hypothetical protein